MVLKIEEMSEEVPQGQMVMVKITILRMSTFDKQIRSSWHYIWWEHFTRRELLYVFSGFHDTVP